MYIMLNEPEHLKDMHTPLRHKKTGYCVRFVIVSVSVQDEIVAQRISERPRHFRRKNIYVNVVEQGSFIRAAEVLELHRPAVTRAVQNLEHDLGVKLLHRTTRQVSMTDEGEEFYQRCLSLLSELDDVRRLFSSTQPPKGRLRLDVPITLARAVIIPALGDFQNRYPDIEIVLGTSDRKIGCIHGRCINRDGITRH